MESKTLEDYVFEDFVVEQSPTEEKIPEASLLSNVVNWANIKASNEKREWIWENYIARGDITVMSAFYKAGKSTFLRCLFKSIGKGDEFIGQPTKKTKILVISEESPDLWREYRVGVKKKYIRHVYVSARPVSASMGTKNWEKMIQEVADFCVEKNIGLVVFDSISNFWQVDDENQAPQVKKALVPLWGLTNKKIGVFLIHHDKKSGGDEAQSLRGSSAFGAFVDHILIFRRDKGNSISSVRTLSYYGRSADAVQNIMMDFTPEEEYIYLGDPYQVSEKAKKEKILSFFTNQGVGLTAKDILDRWNQSVGRANLRTIQRLLRKMVDEGLINDSMSQLTTGQKRGRKPSIYAPTGWLLAA